MSENFFDSITVIGAGNMGTAIAGGLLKYSGCKVCLANRSESRLNKAREAILSASPDKADHLKVTTDLAGSVDGVSLIIIAVKPWAVTDVMGVIRHGLGDDSILISVAAGITLDELSEMVRKPGVGLIKMIPNTAIQIGKGMTFASSKDVVDEKMSRLAQLFSPITKLKFIDESKMDGATALCSCGIAYVYKFIAAAAQAGVELGFSYDDSVDFFNTTVMGASAMIESSDLTLQDHINSVTTPGGMTIRGINELERRGFPAAVIESILTPLKK